MAEKAASARAVADMGVDALLLSAARGVIRAQQEMDAASLSAEIQIREAGLDQALGLAAHWYSIPELDFVFRLAFRVGNRGEVTTDLVDADYQSRYGFDVEASSELTTRILAVPPPEGEGLSLREEAEVLEVAGRIKKVVEAWDRADAPRFVAVYRPSATQGYAGGLWYVLLLDRAPAGVTLLRALVVVSDADGNVVRLWTDEQIQPSSTGVTIEGVDLSPTEVIAILVLVSTATETALDQVVGLSSQTARAILAGRPRTIEALAELPGVGPATIRLLKKYVAPQGAAP